MNRPFKIFAAVAVATVTLASCTADKNAPGVEYMPDMYRSPALEAYVDYGNNKVMDWTQDRKDAAGVVPVLSRKAPVGTIPYQENADMVRFVMPYALNNTPEDYGRSALEIHSPLLAN